MKSVRLTLTRERRSANGGIYGGPGIVATKIDFSVDVHDDGTAKLRLPGYPSALGAREITLADGLAVSVVAYPSPAIDIQTEATFVHEGSFRERVRRLVSEASEPMPGPKATLAGLPPPRPRSGGIVDGMSRNSRFVIS